MAVTPMMRQYREIKSRYPDAILFFQMGDFFEMFFEDAEKAAPVLEVALTGRDAGELGRVPMCGIPVHAVENYLGKLVAGGYRVAICEQVEDAQAARGVVRREVTRVVTPGTLIERQLPDERGNNYLAAVGRAGHGWGLAAADVSTGDFIVGTYTGDTAWTRLVEELARLAPREVLLAGVPWGGEVPEPPRKFGDHVPAAVVTVPDPYLEAAAGTLEAHFGPDAVASASWARHPAARQAAGVLLVYLNETQKRVLSHLRYVRSPLPERHMLLDGATRRNLELTASRDGGRRHTLFGVLDHTVTAMGGRRLRQWLEQPLLVVEEIRERLDAVGRLAADRIKRETLRERLKGMYDIERLAGRVAYGTAHARDLLALSSSLEAMFGVRDLLKGEPGLLGRLAADIDPPAELVDLLKRALADDPPLSLREGGLIRAGYDPEVDRLREASTRAREWLAGLEAQERERTGIRSLKVGYNRVFGYYIEVTRANQHLVPEDYRRRQTLVNAERYITPELKEYESLILGARERMVELEYRLFVELRDRVHSELARIGRSARAVARLDALASLAEAAVRENYTAPVVDDADRIRIKNGRHPVVERVLGPGRFVPNDVLLDSDCRIMILTGPNMAGKSTYMRQVALIVLMAQIGSFVPAEAAEIGVVDRIFTRVGAADNLAGGESTFMVEMNECRAILEQATPSSLIVMDEVGRGTSTYDGMSLARALIEYLHRRVGAKTLFSTHYHELTTLDALPGVVNHTVTVAEEGDEIVFLHRVVPGKADRSYGIQVARLAGLPPAVIVRAREVLERLENGQAAERWKRSATAQLELFPRQKEHPVLSELRRLDVLNMTPLEALSKLDEWQRRLIRERTGGANAAPAGTRKKSRGSEGTS
ncbi:DNA mismatch repair protein MutS [Candidatus Desulforudis audaxviator MP104C]|uniref:DNA mismatch repair protein MutS n=1 Tax=Desulforudis audaxviator (strain MP104C) TaxID=477974 RepID=B1I292_DESAP|nr:DNA mismatch repair protein MutS [Candidatus Desulforudis audaxviator]ACA59094.1 DNA mismatch repair protein MutS [Candidatus Desulforudis audaxviator MP104C]AZK59148.1 DNA mismatch repair protein MutS [Candidatus Desulforudis audaxviator]